MVKKIDVSYCKEFDQHQEVYYFTDDAVGLKGFIAIHNSNLGSATGGTRMFPYISEDEAISDVLKLSRAMTYKCAIAGAQQGGGKAVIIGDPKIDKTEDLIISYAKIIQSLEGKFTTGEDSGINEHDVQLMIRESQYINGNSNTSGDPSPFAALSTYIAMQEACDIVFGDPTLRGKKIAIKGVGNVGSELVKLLAKDGAYIYIADTNPDKIKSIQYLKSNVIIVNPEEIHSIDVDIFAPCSLGAEITEKNKNEIKAKIICGAANNQLENPKIGEYLLDNNIFYVVDYIANCGGLINVIDELEYGNYDRGRVLTRINLMKNTLRRVATLSQSKHVATNYVANWLAESIFQYK